MSEGSTPGASEAGIAKTLDELLLPLTPLQREFLEKLPENNWRPWRTSRAVKISDATLHRWMEEPEFVEARRVLLQRAFESVGATYERTVMEIARVAFSDVRAVHEQLGRMKPLTELDDDTAAAIAAVEVELRGSGENSYEVAKVKLHPKMDALKLLASLHGKLVERHEHTGKDGGPIRTEEISDFEKARRVAFLLARGMQMAAQGQTTFSDSPPEGSGNAPQTTL